MDLQSMMYPRLNQTQQALNNDSMFYVGWPQDNLKAFISKSFQSMKTWEHHIETTYSAETNLIINSLLAQFFNDYNGKPSGKSPSTSGVSDLCDDKLQETAKEGWRLLKTCWILMNRYSDLCHEVLDYVPAKKTTPIQPSQNKSRRQS
jgi:hypothetical protein